MTDGLLQWSGFTEDIGSPYQVPPDEKRCTYGRILHDDDGGPILDAVGAILKRRCDAWAMIGTGLCIDHANGSAAVQNAARQRILAAADAVVGALTAIALDPEEKATDRIKALNSLLDRAGIRGGIEVNGEIKGFEKVLQILMDEESGRGTRLDD